MTPKELQELLLRTKAKIALAQEQHSRRVADEHTNRSTDNSDKTILSLNIGEHAQNYISQTIDQLNDCDSVDLSQLGVSPENSELAREQTEEIISDIFTPDFAAEETTLQDIQTKDINTAQHTEKPNEHQIGPDKEQTPIQEQDTEEITQISHAQKTGVERDIILNEKQQQFADLVATGQDCVLIGAAGTGKTTCMRQVTQMLMNSGRIGMLGSDTKYLSGSSPGAVIVAFTRKAVNNIRKAVDERLKKNTITIHKLLEFAPEKYQIEDPDKPGTFKWTMKFEPRRNADNPLPSSLKFIAHEESSMESVWLYNLRAEAMPHAYQEVFLGDIQQLPPTFGLAILGFKMLELPVVELTEIHRQAQGSPITRLAWKLLEGNPLQFNPTVKRITIKHPVTGKPVERNTVPALQALEQESEAGTVIFQPWQKKLNSDNALITIVRQFCQWTDSSYYNPQEDIILCPYNVSFGTIEINKGIAQHLGFKRQAIVHEVIAGFNKHYLAVGDRVLYDKEDAFIIDIARNSNYLGTAPTAASTHLDRWGIMQEKLSDTEEMQRHIEESELELEALEAFMQSSVEDRVQAASHVVILRMAGDDEIDFVPVELDASAEINALLGGYAITVHKAQGSEYEKVFIALHNSHAKMVSRELLYTAVTRARSFLHIICETDTFFKGVSSQRIGGDTWEAKAEKFKGKMAEGQDNELPIEKKMLEISVVPAEQSTTKDEINPIIEVQQEQQLTVSQQLLAKLAALKHKE